MRKSISVAFVAAALLTAAPIALDRAATPGVWLSTAQAATDVDINVFFTSLSPYGSWVPSPNYNYVWVPTNVDASWSPYTNGHWIYTEQYGWYFVSDEPFAAIVYHYGRWGYDPLIGWYWVPGTHWAPAWVAWRQDNDDIGWAPLPPQGNGYATSISISINIGDVPDHYWRFVPNNQFLAPQLRTVAFAGDQRPEVFRASRPAGVVVVQNNIVVNNVINLNFVEQQTKQTIMPAKIDVVTDPKQAGGNATADKGGSVNAFIASVAPPSATVMPQKIEKPTDIKPPTKDQVDLSKDKSATQFTAISPTGNLPNTGNGPAGGNGPGGKNGPSGSGPTGQPTGTATTAPGGNAPGGKGPPNSNGPSGNPTGTATTSPNGGQPGGANPRCTDPTFAKNNPKTCPTSTNDSATANPNAGAPTGNNPTGGPPPKGGNNTATTGPTGGAPTGSGPTGTGNNNTKGGSNTATTGPTGGSPTGSGPAGTGRNTGTGTAATGNPGATVNGNGKGGGSGTGANPTGNANANTATCANPEFARANPKTCPPANSTGGGKGGGGGNDGQQGFNTRGGGGGGGNNTTTNTTQQTNNVGPTGKAPGNAGASATGSGNVTVQGNASCSDPKYAKANPTVCMPEGPGNGRGR